MKQNFKFFVLVLVMLAGGIREVMGQTTTYTVTPTVTNCTGMTTQTCPSSVTPLNYEGNVFKLTYINTGGNTFNFRLTKCNGGALSSLPRGGLGGWFNARNFLCAGVFNNFNGSQEIMNASESQWDFSLSAAPSFTSGSATLMCAIGVGGTPTASPTTRDYYYTTEITITATTTNACGQPTGLGTTPGNNSVTLLWGSVSGATSYKVFRNNTQIATPNTNNYTDNTVTNGTNYCYKVSAIGTCTESTQSAQACATPTSGTPPATSLSASPTSLNFDNTGSPARTVTVTASSGINWTATPNDAWITINSGSGSGNGSFSVSCSNNSSTSSRNGSITLSASSLPSVMVNVSQDGSAAPPPSSLSASPASLSFVNTGTPSQNLNIFASGTVNWTATTTDSWITVNSGSGTGDGTISVNCSNNGGTSSRNGSVTISGSGGVSNVTVNVSQDGTPAADVQCTALNVPATLPRGNTITITAILKNLGGIASLSSPYILRWGSTVLKTETFSLAPNETRTVTYTGRRDDAVGAYIVTISEGAAVMIPKTVNIINPSATSTGGLPNPAPADGACETYTIGTDAEEWAVVNNLPSWAQISNVTSTSFKLCVNRNDLTQTRDIIAFKLLLNQLVEFSLPPVHQAAQTCPTVGSLTVCATRILQSGSVKTASGDVKIYLTASGVNSAALRSLGDVSINGNIISGSGGLYVENIAAGWGRVELISGSFSFDVNSATIKRPVTFLLNSVFKLAGGSVKIDNIQILTNGIRVEGMFIPMSIYGYTPIFINTLQITSTDGVKLDGKICLPPLSYGGVSLTNSCLTFVNTANPKRFDLGTTFKMPILGEISVGGQVTEFCLNPPVITLPKCSAEINSFYAEWSPSTSNPALIFPAISMTRLKGSVTNLAKYNREGLAPNPVTLTGEIDLATYPDPFLKAQPISLTYKVGQSVEGLAKLNLFNKDFAGINIKLTTTSFKSYGYLDLYTMVTGNHFANVNYANKLQFIGSVKGDIKMPSQATLNQITFDNDFLQVAWGELKRHLPSGNVLGAGTSIIANTLGNSKLGTVGTIKTPYTINTKIFSWNGELFYKLLWRGGTDFNVSMSKDYNTIKTEFSQGVSSLQNGAGSWRTETDKQYATFYLGDATTDLVIGMEGQGEMANFSINLPNGKNISAGNVGQYANIKRTEIAATNTVIYSIGNPINGKYIVEIDAPFNRMQVLRRVNPPSIAMAAITQNTTNKTLNIQWKDDDIDSDAKIQLAYDNNRADLDGVAFVDTIRKDNTSNQYVWNYGNVPTGNYYIYGFVQDSIGLFSSSYSDKKFKLIHQNAPLPPTNLGFNTSDTTLRLFWNPSPTSGVNYVVHYANKPNTVDFDSPSFAAGDTTYIDFKDFQAGKYYEFMVTAVDTTVRRLQSDYTNVVNLTFNPINLNKVPTIVANNLPTVAKIGTTYNYVVNATDPDGGVLVYSFAENPTGMTISNTGLITWNPTIDNWGYHRIKVYVADALAAKDSLEYQLFATDFSEPRNHAYFNFNKPLYVNHDDKAQIDLTDLGYNGNILVKDSVQATIYSKSDTQGFKLWFKETEPDSKVFRTEFNLTQTASIANTATLKVVKGDTIFATYRNPSYPKVVSNFAHFTLLEAKFEVTKNPNCASDSVYFKNLSTGTGLTYLWTSDDGTGITSNFQNPIRLFPVNTLREYFVVTLTIKDRLGRTSSYSKSVRRVSKPIVKAVFKNISCKGQIDGSIDLTVLGAFPRFTVKWTHNPALTAWSLRNLAKGTYKAIVTDSVGCQDSIKVTIIEPDSIKISAQVTHNTRYGERNGKVNLIISGGTPNSLGNYSVVWKDSLGVTVATTEDLINLPSGLFIAYVKDSMNCEHKPFPVLIISPDSFYIKKADIKAISCSSAKNGSLNLLLHGGTAPYRMLSNKTGNDTIRLIGNTYSFSNLDLTTGERIEVVFIDKNNIAISRRFEIKEPTGIRKLTYSKTTYTFLDGIITPTLENVRFGSYSIVPNGAVMDSTGKVNLEQSIVNRTYTVRYITGVELCDTTKFTFRLVATDSLLVVPIISLPDCKDSKNGSVRLNISTKSLPTKIRWSTGDTTAIINNLDYTTSPLIVNVFDANNKKVSLKINLPAPKGTPKISYSKNNYCNTETNPIATVSGMYNYSFASQPQGIVFLDSGTIDLQKSKTGNYNVQVLTPAGCIASTAINIFGLPIKQFYNKNIIACEKLTLDAGNSAMPNVSYKWSNGETTQRITVTKSGTYIVTINSGLCQIQDTIKVQISNLVVTTKATHLRGNGSIANGEIDVISILGNIGNATIMWADIPSVQRKRTGLKAGTYKFTVKDTLCYRDYQIEVKAPIVLKVTASKTDDTGCGGANGEIFLEIFGNGNETVSINGVVVKDARLGKLKAGLYKWTVKDTTGQELNGDVLLASADSLSAKIKTFDASCTNDGKVILDITGGRKPYTIEYTDVVTGTVKTANSNEITGLSVTSNEYIFVITDATGCKVQVRTRIRKSVISNLVIADSSTICEGNKAFFTVKYKGGLYPYSFSYSANREIFTVSGVMDSVYKVEVSPKITTLYRLTDLRYGANCLGTFAGQSFVTVNPLPILLNAQASDENCDNKDATILLSDKDVKAGKTPFLFAIQKVDSKDSLKFVKLMKFDSLAAGNYEVFVKDANTCVYKYPKVVVIKNVVCDLPNRLPNCITPNGDGINDTFEIRNAEFYPAMTMEIQDRFGRVIYKGSYKAWNPNDTNEAMGTYFYLINLGNGKIFKNFIDVVR